ncbi:MAG TPA: hypothetical protein VFD48_13525 [Pyrinomonadaceae bacterium]|nr:hypothetical protein [Pyrinomonadaceae bacterium]
MRPRSATEDSEPRYPSTHLSAEPDESRFRSRVQRRQKKLRLPAQKLIRWEIWCIVNQIAFQKLVEDALDLFMMQSELCGYPGTQVPTINDLNDLNDDEGKNLEVSSSDQLLGNPGTQSPAELKARSVIDFYVSKTGNKAKPRDREAYENGHSEWQGVSDLPEHVIQYGIMESVLVCRTRVNSFAYCLDAIHRASEARISIEVVSMLLRTWDVRLAAKQNPALNSSEVDTASPHFQEYFENLRRAGAQSTLPQVGADLVEMKTNRPSPEATPVPTVELEIPETPRPPESQRTKKPGARKPLAAPPASGRVVQFALFKTGT